MNDSGDQLVLVVFPSYQGAVGFGELFDCEVQRVIEGTMDDPHIRLSILAGDAEKLNFLSEHLRPSEVVITFRLKQKDEPYGLMPISGFVDRAKNSWEIIDLQEA